MTYTNEDFERFYIRYKAEAVPNGESMQSYCYRNKVPTNLFLKWYKDTRHRLVPVTVDGMPRQEETGTPEAVPEAGRSDRPQPRILVDIKVSNGLHISRGNLNYKELLKLIQNLEVLC